MNTYLVDTRNQKDSFVVEGLEALGHKVIRTKLLFGDVANVNDIFNVIDLKSSGGGLIELAKNRCSGDHARMTREIQACLSVGGKITFMCFEPRVSCIDDIANWDVPTFKADLYKTVKVPGCPEQRICLHLKGQKMTQVKPETLMKSLRTMTEQDHYGEGFKVNLVFAEREHCAEKIIDILGG